MNLVPPPPPLDELSALYLVQQMECLPGFPKTDPGVERLAKSLCNMCGEDTKRAEWLINRICEGADRCPTPIEMRRIYVKTYKPADGIEDNQADVSDQMNRGGRRSGAE